MKKVIVIVGPTAIGKTKISVELAKKLNLDIINGDSVSIYKKLDIGSAKVTKEEMDSVKHYLVDTVDPKTEYSTSHFQEDARGIIEKNNPIIIAGGTGLYISSVIYDYDFSAKPRDDKFMEQFSTYPNYELYKYLESIDPEFDQEKIHINNRKRVLRAIEIKMTTGESISKNALHLISADSGADIDLRLDVLIEELIAQDREDLVAIINKKLSGKRIVGTDYRRLRAARKLIEDICLS